MRTDMADPTVDAGNKTDVTPPPGEDKTPPAKSAAEPPSEDKGNGQDKAGDWPTNWRELMAGGDEKQLKLLQRLPSPPEVWKKARSLEVRLDSGELKPVLPKDASAEQLAEWRKAHGIPDKAEGYDFKRAKGEDWDDPQKEGLARLAPKLHAVNAPPQVAQAVADWLEGEIAEREQAQFTADEGYKQATEDALRAEWGEEYRKNLKTIHNLLDTAPAGVKDQILHARLGNGTPFGSDPEVLRWLLSMATEINPAPTLVPGTPGTQGKSVDDRIAEIEKIMREDRKRYNRDEKLQGELRQLYDWRQRNKKA